MTLLAEPDTEIAPRFRDVMASEWTKLRSLRSTAWSLVALAVLCLGMCALLTTLFTSGWDKLSETDRLDMQQDTIGLILQPGALYGQIALCVLGALLMAGEYSTGMIRSSMLAVPSRIPVLLGKAAVFAVVTFVVAEVIAVASFVIGSTVVHKHVPISFGSPDVGRALVGYGISLTLTALLALAVGTLVRHTAGAITTVLGMVLVVPTVVHAFPGKIGDYVSTYVPGGNAGQEIMSTGRGDHSVIGPWTGIAVAAAWTVLALLLAGVSLRSRDV